MIKHNHLLTNYHFRYRKELHQHGIQNLETPLLPEVDLKLPKLLGNNIEDHFYNIANQQVETFKILINQMLKAEVPKMPKVI